MAPYTIEEARRFTGELEAKQSRCDNNEGNFCSTLDATLSTYADICCDFHEAVRNWASAIFRGDCAYEEAVERHFLFTGAKLLHAAAAILPYAIRAENRCYQLEAKASLELAGNRLADLLDNWVTPEVAVGPSRRLAKSLTREQIESAKLKIAGLPPLAAEWQPYSESQRRLLRKIRGK
jgi:hypothetical protein